MSNVTRNDVWELAKSRSNDLVKLASDLIVFQVRILWEHRET